LDGFNDKFEKFQAYWVSEAENFALKTRSEELEAEVGYLKTQLFDFSEIKRKQVKKLEDRSDLLEESFLTKIEADKDMTKEYVDGKIDAFQKHGISANALEDIANLQHSLAKVHTQIDLLKDTDASITADISLTSGNMASLSGQMSVEMTGNISQSEETTEQDLTETENSTISTVTETGDRNKNEKKFQSF